MTGLSSLQKPLDLSSRLRQPETYRKTVELRLLKQHGMLPNSAAAACSRIKAYGQAKLIGFVAYRVLLFLPFS